MKNLNYGVIGNGKSAALVSEHGSIDWCCLPNFDSPSVFAKLLDAKIGGSFVIKPQGDYQIRQTYLRKTNVLKTEFRGAQACFELIDFMPRYRTATGSYHWPISFSAAVPWDRSWRRSAHRPARRRPGRYWV